MAAAGYPLISREGWFYIASTVVAAQLLYEFAGWPFAVPFWILAALLLFLFRDPERDVPSRPLAVVSPADGRIVLTSQCRDPYLERDAVCVSIRMSPLGVYSTRSPIEGKVQNRWHSPATDKTPEQDPRSGIWIETDEGDKVAMVMHRPSALRSPRCYVNSGERVGQGQRCGFIRFGARIDLFLPANSRLDVNVGDRVRAGSDVIATILHK